MSDIKEYLVGWKLQRSSSVFKLVEANGPTEAITRAYPPINTPCIVIATDKGSRLMRRQVTEIVVADVD